MEEERRLKKRDKETSKEQEGETYLLSMRALTASYSAFCYMIIKEEARKECTRGGRREEGGRAPISFCDQKYSL